ncbi:hypothetical protein JHK82_034949 [Glycine max]|nr:hypothetical protein JHK87_034868 [Glycine soja]KAG4969238.1 hypothetical protein JHK85_035659 [Glycine max]KAG5111680.1 hypothetical protein JHK82_034949 [Glycine max]KAG5128931.1 hypothetical protein JHK84_035328 [Glycine max]
MGSRKMFILHSIRIPRWKKEIVKYLKYKTPPTNKKKAKKLRTQVVRYILVASELYRRGFSSPILKCLDQDQANYVL